MESAFPVNILIVDDHPENLLAMVAVLEDLGQNLVTARSGEEALRAVLHHDFAVILLDVQMAGIDGFETAKLIKQREKSQYTPIIFVTAINRTEQHVFTGYDIGAVDYLFKPIVPEVLKAKVTVFVDLFRKNAEIQFQASQLAATNEALEAKMELERVLKSSLAKITDLYRTSQGVGTVRTIDDVLASLLDSNFLNIREATAIVFDAPWETTPPVQFKVHSAASKIPGTNDRMYHWHPFEAYPFAHLLSRETFVLIENVKNDERLSPATRAALDSANVTQLMLFPLSHTSWYGALELQFGGDQAWTADDLRHIETLAEQVLMTIDNLMLLQSEAEARAEAERANQLKVQFLGMISHELRTPLTSIKGFATSLLADDVVWDDETERYFLSIIDEETDKLTALIEQLLDLSRLQAGTLGISPQLCDFATVIEQAKLHLNVLARAHQLSITLMPPLPPVVLDTDRIAQVLENLVGNSVKFSAADTEIKVIVWGDREGIQVDVVDQGCGIPEDEQPHIFEAFHQIRKNRSTRGAGLGLAICRGLIEAHGGRIWIQDTSPKGTTISFFLPAASLIQDGGESLARFEEM